MTFCLRAGNGPVAQRSEQATHNRSVVGSTPTGPTILTSTYVSSVERLIVLGSQNGHEMVTNGSRSRGKPLQIGPRFGRSARAVFASFWRPKSSETDRSVSVDEGGRRDRRGPLLARHDVGVRIKGECD